REKLMEQMEYDIDRLRNNEIFQEMYKYSMFFYEQRYSLLDYLPEDSLVIIDEMSRVQEVAHSLDTEEAELYESLLEQRQIAPGITHAVAFEAVWANEHYQTVYTSLSVRQTKGSRPHTTVNVSGSAMGEYDGQTPLFESDM